MSIKESSVYQEKQVAGKVIYGSNILRGIINLAVKEVHGIVALHGRGARLKTIGKELSIDLFVSTLSTIKCREVAFSVQENVKNNIESATDYIVKEINVNILNVSSPLVPKYSPSKPGQFAPGDSTSTNNE